MVSSFICDSKEKKNVRGPLLADQGLAYCPKIYCSFNSKNSIFQNEIALPQYWTSSIDHKPKLIDPVSPEDHATLKCSCNKCRLYNTSGSLKFYIRSEN